MAEPSEGLDVLRADEHDLEDLVEAERACFARPWSRRVLADELALAESATLIVSAPSPPRIVAYAIARVLRGTEHPGSAELLRLGVRPEHRRRALARTLTRTLIDRLVELGIGELHLEVREDNAPARALYSGLGFVEVGRRRGYYEDRTAAVLLTLDLAREEPSGGHLKP